MCTGCSYKSGSVVHAGLTYAEVPSPLAGWVWNPDVFLSPVSLPDVVGPRPKTAVYSCSAAPGSREGATRGGPSTFGALGALKKS